MLDDWDNDRVPRLWSCPHRKEKKLEETDLDCFAVLDHWQHDWGIPSHAVANGEYPTALS